jgi:OOP family OmpA-OmpF porin
LQQNNILVEIEKGACCTLFTAEDRLWQNGLEVNCLFRNRETDATPVRGRIRPTYYTSRSFSADITPERKKNMKKLISMLAVSAAFATSAIAQTAPTAPPYAPVTQDIKAATPKSAYVQDARGVIARDPFGLCWRTGYWTPADAVPGCDLPICVEPEKLENGKCVAPPPPPAPAPAPAPAPMPAPKPVPVPTAQKVSFAADAFFDFDKAVLKPEGKAKLDDLTSKLGSINLEVIIAVGHTDSVGTDEYNQKLSVRRAEAVKAYIISKGVEANRVYTEGKGEKQPVADNKTAEGRAKNRRVEIEVVGTSK